MKKHLGLVLVFVFALTALVSGIFLITNISSLSPSIEDTVENGGGGNDEPQPDDNSTDAAVKYDDVTGTFNITNITSNLSNYKGKYNTVVANYGIGFFGNSTGNPHFLEVSVEMPQDYDSPIEGYRLVDKKFVYTTDDMYDKSGTVIIKAGTYVHDWDYVTSFADQGGLVMATEWDMPNSEKAKFSVRLTYEVQKKVSITLSSNGGNGGSTSVTATVGSSVLSSTITNPTRTAYSFEGWTATQNGTDVVISKAGALVAGVDGYTDSNGYWIKETATTLYAKWTPVNYTITYNPAGGTMPSTSYTTNYTCSTSIILPTPTRPGYNFAGWTVSGSDHNWGSSVYEAGGYGGGFHGNVTLTAKWTEAQYPLVYIWNDDSIPLSDLKSFAANTSENTGIKINWSQTFSIRMKIKTPTSFSSRSLIIGNYSSSSGATTLSIEIGNGSNAGKVRVYLGNGSIDKYYSKPLLTNTEYTVSFYWYPKLAGSDEQPRYNLVIYNDDHTSEVSMDGDCTGVSGTATNSLNIGAADHRGSATFGAISATLPTYIYTNSSTPNSNTVTYNSNYPEFPTLVANNADLVKWSTNAEGTDTITSSTKFTGTSFSMTFAIWSAKKTTVSLSANGGTAGSTTSVSATYGSSMPSIAESALPKRTGYTFAGFFDTNQATGGTQYYTAKGASAHIWDKNSATATLYARWTANQTTVTLNAKGGTGGTGSVTATFDQAMPSATMPKRAGYIFAGYYDTDATSGGNMYYTAAGGSNKNWDKAASTATLYARWTAQTTTITLNRNFNSSDSTNLATNIKITFGASTFSGLPSTPTRTGYTFAGYFTSRSGGTQIISTSGTIVKPSASNTWVTSSGTWNYSVSNSTAPTLTLYAQWTADSHTLRVNPNGGQKEGYSVDEDRALFDPDFPSRGATALARGAISLAGQGYYYTPFAYLAIALSNVIPIGYQSYGSEFVIKGWFDYEGMTGECIFVRGLNNNRYELFETIEFTAPNGCPLFGGADILNKAASEMKSAFESFVVEMSGCGAVEIAEIFLANRDIYEAIYNDFLGLNLITDIFYKYHFRDTPPQDSAGEVVDPFDVTLKTDQTYTLDTYSRTGYTFAGWELTQPGNKTELLTKLSGSTVTMGAGDATVTAKWTPKTYNVTLSPNGGKGGDTTVTATYDSPLPSVTLPTRDNYNFFGYYDENGKQYYSASGVGAVWDKDGTATLTARWQEKTWDDYAEAFSGNGTQTSPYIIDTPGKLAQLAKQSRTSTTYASKYFKLTANLDMSAHIWVGIGSATQLFTGNLDGNWKIIYGIKTTGENFESVATGLFNFIGKGTVKNLYIKDSAISTISDGIGGVVGTLEGGTITNIQLENMTIGVDNDDCIFLAGIAGYAKGGSKITACAIRNSKVMGGLNAALVASVENSSTLKDCFGIGVTVTDRWDDSACLIYADSSSSNVQSCFVEGKFNSLSKKDMIGGSSAWTNWSQVDGVNESYPTPSPLYHSGSVGDSEKVYNWLKTNNFTEV